MLRAGGWFKGLDQRRGRKVHLSGGQTRRSTPGIHATPSNMSAKSALTHVYVQLGSPIRRKVAQPKPGKLNTTSRCKR